VNEVYYDAPTSFLEKKKDECLNDPFGPIPNHTWMDPYEG
jgi:hypothetical protein